VVFALLVELISCVASRAQAERRCHVAVTTRAADPLLVQRPALQDVGADVRVRVRHPSDADEVDHLLADDGLGHVGEPVLEGRVAGTDEDEPRAVLLESRRKIDKPGDTD